MIDPVDDISRLADSLHCQWPNLKTAKARAEAKRQELRDALEGFDSEDTSIVVSGSLARNEFTEGSDIDWTLLIDGLADPKHHDQFRSVRTIANAYASKKPGAEGTFGAMVFSHDLIHQIGGEDDTNQNTTRRLLLLLESKVVGREDAYLRVTRHVLSRYLLEDRGLWRGSGHRVPRFLQNDIARYWRTMAVDFAYKLRNRSGKGWAIRNLKLRMSRKLIYASGLLACFRCHLDYSTNIPPDHLLNAPGREKELVEHLRLIFAATPLEIVAGVLLRVPHLSSAARDIFDSYDQFIGILANPLDREHLESLSEEGESDKLYQEARILSHRFRDGLLALFFDEQSGMEELTKIYGVF